MVNFFRAADTILVDGRDRTETVVYKSNGLYFLLGISKWVFNSIYSTSRDFRVASIENCIQSGLDGLADMYQVAANP